MVESSRHVMVRGIRYTGAVLRLVRFPNLLIVAGTQILIRYCVLLPLLRYNKMTLQLTDGLFVWLVLATVFVTAGGYAINDYFDRKIDRVNRPGSQVVGRIINPRHAMAFHLVSSSAGVLMGTWVSFRAGQPYLSLIFFMVSGLLWFYSTTYKKELLLGNILVSLLTALVPFLVLLFELPGLAHNYGHSALPVVKVLMVWVLGFCIFAFLLNLVREIVKDSEDFEGDHAYGKQTIPVIWGIRTARIITIVILVFSVLGLIAAWHFYIPDWITGAYFLFLLIAPMLYVMIMIAKGRAATFHRASLTLKLIMVSGIVYMIVVNLIINRLV